MQSDFSRTIMDLRYSWIKPDGTKETWEEIAERVVDNVFSIRRVNQDIIDEVKQVIKDRKFIPGGRFLAQSGRDFHQVNNCFTLIAEDTREGWGELANKATVMLMTGGGIGINYNQIRPSGATLKRTGGTSSGPLPLARVINEIGRGVIAGGKRRSAIYASLNWKHPDIFDFIQSKNWPIELRKLKEQNVDHAAPLDMTNISVQLDKEFFKAFDNGDSWAHDVYTKVIDRMCRTGEPGFQIDYHNAKEVGRNACTEVVSEDDCDLCCLGSINLANIETVEELRTVTNLSILFLILGGEYSDVPFSKVKQVRINNRRLGLGLMGIHEWLIKRGLKYEPNKELAHWLASWKEQSEESSIKWADRFNFNEPVAIRAIAPNGSTSIAGGQTTGGIEPVFATAYQRRYLTPDGWKKQYVVDFVAEKLVEQGIDPATMEDAYTLAQDVEKRIAFQAFIQKYVDNAISSTINLPAFGLQGNNNIEKFGKILYSYLPNLRGITVYPDSARSGQPIQKVDFSEAIKRRGVVFEANEDTCKDGICGL
jgi:ribonucleoside-diphosphate reductase alpha chain